MATETLLMPQAIQATAMQQQQQEANISTDLKAQAQKYGIPIDFDPDALMARYVEERVKRDHNGGMGQYVRAQEVKVLDYEDDPYANGDGDRPPVTATYDAVILGAGYTSLQAAARLIQKGITNICLVEKGEDVGGTW